MSNAAASWLQGLADRGVTVAVKSGRLRMSPEAFKTLTDSELLTLRHHREEIKAAVAAGTALTARPAPTPQAPDLACPFCYRAPCIGRTHPAFPTLHSLDPHEQQRLDAEQQSRDYEEWEGRRRFRMPSPEWT